MVTATHDLTAVLDKITRLADDATLEPAEGAAEDEHLRHPFYAAGPYRP